MNTIPVTKLAITVAKKVCEITMSRRVIVAIATQ